MSISICDLACSIQHGDQAAVLALWDQVKGTARAVVRKYGGLSYVDSDDLLQLAFLAMLEAAKAYDSARGDFKTIFIYYVRCLCGRALNLHRRMIEEAYSLDQPAADGSAATILDLVEDESLVPAQDQLEAGELSDVLRAAMDELPERWRVVLEERYVHGRTLTEAGKRLGCTYQNAARLEAQALRRLRENKEIARMYRGS